ncbi:unnamed protein product, partial [Rotaria sp. Silwood2]
FYEAGLDPADAYTDFIQLFQLENDVTKHLLAFARARAANQPNCLSPTTWSIYANNGAKMIFENQDVTSATILNQPLYVLKTDYDHYALTYKCVTPNYNLDQPCQQRTLNLYSRKPFLESKYLVQLESYIINVLCFNSNDIIRTPFRRPFCYPIHSKKNRYST